MSDPSANLNTFVRGMWKSKAPANSDQAGKRSRSQGEGLDYYSDGVHEIEAGDPRDGEFQGY